MRGPDARGLRWRRFGLVAHRPDPAATSRREHRRIGWRHRRGGIDRDRRPGRGARARPTPTAAPALMPAFGGYVFEVGEGLPALPANSTGYHFPAGASVDAADVSRIAAALGIDGEAEPAATDSGYQWRGRPGRRHRAGTVRGGRRPARAGTTRMPGRRPPSRGVLSPGAWAPARVPSTSARAPSTRLSTQPSASPSTNRCRPVTCRRATSPPTNRSRSTSARPPSHPTGVPTADEAAAKANELLAALGEDPAAFELETYADEWNASVTAYPKVDGVRWPNGLGFGFGGEGALIWANGTLAEPVATGPYPLVDLDTATRQVVGAERDVGLWRRRCARRRHQGGRGRRRPTRSRE